MDNKSQDNSSEENKKKSRISQTNIPSYSLEEALRIPIAITENYASKPTEPFKVAKAMNLLPNSTAFRMIAGAAIAYGLTEGGPQSERISITQLARRILHQAGSKDALIARREALLKPRIIRQFLENYNGSPLPKESIAQEMLESFGVPSERTHDVLAFIIDSANAVSIIEEIKGKKYVSLDADLVNTETEELDDFLSQLDAEEQDIQPDVPVVTQFRSSATDDARRRKVFITHGKNRAFLELIKKLLQFGELEPVIAAETQSVAEPVPDKVMNEMRNCGAAIIHVDAEQKLMDAEATAHVIINANVLIEIGAAMALYGRRFILLVREGVSLPSNLQGLYEVRYSGDSLDGDTTIKLLEAINQMKNREFPS